MDDKRFDDIIKGKVGEYVDPQYDEGAIAGLHQHLAAYQAVPWYIQYRSVLMAAASLAIFTLINWWLLQSYRPNNEGGNSNNFNPDLIAYQTIIDDLSKEVKALRAVKQDTIFIVKNQSTLASTDLSVSSVNAEQVINSFLQQLKSEEKIGSIGNFFFYHKDDVINYEDFSRLRSLYSGLDGSTLTLQQPNRDTLYFGEAYIAPESEAAGKMPVIVLRDLERHYAKGLGLKIGAEADFNIASPKNGSGEGLPGAGLLGELIFSPSLSLETGLKYKTRSYTFENLDNETLASLPETDQLSGTLNEAEVDVQLIEFPINLKYYRLIDQRKSAYLSVGLSPNLYLNQSFEYELSPEGGTEDQSTVRDVAIGQSSLYLGTLNFSTGLNFNLPKRRSAQVGVFYQRSLGGLGVDDLSFNIYGIKSSYWFRAR